MRRIDSMENHFISSCLIRLELLARVDKYGHISIESIYNAPLSLVVVA